MIRPPMTNFKMTVRADCTFSTCSPLPPPVIALAHSLSVGGIDLWTGVHPPCPHPLKPPPPVASHRNKTSFPFHQPCLFIGFWAANSWTLLLVTVSILGIYPAKTVIQEDKCTPMLIPAVFTIAKTWKQSKCPSTGEWIKKMCCI